MRTGRRTAHALIAAFGFAASIALATPEARASTAQLGELPQHWQDDDGRALELGAFAGERVVLTMAYASCHRICPATIAALGAMQKALDARGEQVAFVVVGYDPAHDDAEAWHRYRLSHHLGRANWHFLSGSQAATEALARRLGFEFWTYDEHVMHGARVVIFDAHGQLETTLGSETRDWAAAL